MSIDPCESRLTVHLACRNLRNMDIIGRSDPFALLFLDDTGATAPRRTIPTSSTPSLPGSSSTPAGPSNSDDVQPNVSSRVNTRGLNPTLRSARASGYVHRDPRWKRIGMTETIPNTLNVDFTKSFEIPYFFERSQRLAVDVFDRDSEATTDDLLYQHDFLGSVETALPPIVRARGQQLSLPLSIPHRPNARCGTVTIIVEEVSELRQRLSYNVTIERLPRLSMFSSRHNGPFLTVSRRAMSTTMGNSPTSTAMVHADVTSTTPSGISNSGRMDQRWLTVLRTKAALPTTTDRYVIRDFNPSYEKLCRCNDDLPLRFELSFEKHGKHRVVASATSTLRTIDGARGRLELGGKKRHHGPRRGDAIMTLSNRVLSHEASFLDYIIGGCEISLVIGVDFTASNGDPSKQGTRHFVDTMQSNEYEMAIREVGDILAAYDSDQLIPAYGFGARLPPRYDQTSHLFALNQQEDAHCYAIDEVLNMYRQSLYTVRLSGPTHFAEVIRRAAQHCRSECERNEQSYTILLIVTDGVISDMAATQAELLKATSLPLSVVIVGVGEEDFTDMIRLDGDDLQQERDIVQFVCFRQFRNSPEVLRSRVLEEIPGQFIQYMQKRGIHPRPPPEIDG